MNKKLEFKIKHDYQYQIEAVKAITDIFEGQKEKDSLFTVTSYQAQIKNEQMLIPTENQQLALSSTVVEPGVANTLDLLNEELLENIQRIQLRNGLPKSESLHNMNFSIEMETGTGKTYVYLRTIFELNKLYGFKKFIIVVPSIAIKEGVNKSIEIMGEPLRSIYDNANFHSFVYDSSELERVRNFATSTTIEIMIINIQAFRRSFTDPSKMSKANIFHREIDTLNGRKPQELIAETNPILIIDEPQSVDRTSKSKEAIASLGTLFTLRYSATHYEEYNLMYKLDPVDAYERKLVKKIVVDSIRSEDNFNKPYIRLVSVNDMNGYSAKVEVDMQSKSGSVNRTVRKVITHDDLYDITGEREQYGNGYIITNIECYPGNEHIEFRNGDKVHMGSAIGDVADDVLKRAQIRKAIESHLVKEQELYDNQIKVLSLFFIDRVANYRSYDEDGNPQKGKYHKMFEEEYLKAIRNRQQQLRKLENGYLDYVDTDVDEIHDGYFACDRKRDAHGEYMLMDSKTGEAQTDESVYDLIMKEKEKLLSFDTPLRFIFSHSALKEGWDNPNVFQICTLIEMKEDFTKRQKLGRGLRLAVDQNGERSQGHEINVLTVVANESFAEFAEKLQGELASDAGIKFGVIEQHSFASIVPETEDGIESGPIGYEKSRELWNHLKEREYINNAGKVQDKLKIDLNNDTLELPDAYKDIKNEVINVIKKSTRKLEISDKKDEVSVKINKRVYLDPEFDALWDKIKYKTMYSVDIDIQELIKRSSEQIKRMSPVPMLKIASETVDVEIGRSGVIGKKRETKHFEHVERDFTIPDILRYIQDNTGLTRKTIAEILNRADRYEDFLNNPQKFMERVIEIISFYKKELLVDGIKYERIGDQQYYKQELFEVDELKGYLNSNVIQSSKSPYTQVYYDSGPEKEFAEHMERDPQVKVYAKLPDKFVIDTPFGSYNPDWAVLLNIDGEERLYFIIETKGSSDRAQLRLMELGKIECGKKHFEALNTGVDYRMAHSYDEFRRNV